MVLRSLPGAALLSVGAALVLCAVVLPVVREVEFGLPYGMKVVAAVEDRAGRLRAHLAAKRSELELWCQLMCDDPVVAARLLEAACSRTVTVWRGPASPGLTSHVLCSFLALLTAQQRWAPPAVGTPAAALSALPPAERAVVVLTEFARLPPDEVAGITGRSPSFVAAALERGERLLSGLDASGTSP